MIVAICGAGTMGRGIAIASLVNGHSVKIHDVNPAPIASAIEFVHRQLDSAVSKGKLDPDLRAKADIRAAEVLEDLADAEIVIEAIAERMDIKRALFTALEGVVSSSCILASNTSSIAITALAAGLQHPERFVGLHFFNPAHIMKLVEVIRGKQTSQDIVEVAVAFARGLGKTPVVAADVPGFIVNRVARNYYNEPQRLVMETAATIPQVDTLMKSLGFKMGPFELMDLIGVDVNLDVTTSQWQQFFQEPRFTPSLLQRQYVEAGLHGRKSGSGFYDYNDTP